MQRRDFLATASAAFAGAALARPASATLPLRRVGLELYSVRTAMRKDPEGTFKAVGAMGYDDVELLGSFKNFDRTRDLIVKMDEAVRMNGNCERAHFYRGMLHKRTENPKQALKDFKRAVELNPHNLDAAREIRLYGMRQPAAAGGKPDGSVGGLFGRLFKK